MYVVLLNSLNITPCELWCLTKFLVSCNLASFRCGTDLFLVCTDLYVTDFDQIDTNYRKSISKCFNCCFDLGVVLIRVIW